MPLVSVGIPAYGRPEGLERAARSALAQSERDLEVVVADDASPDPEVARVAARLAAEDGRLRFVRNERNLGHEGNYQRVLELATGEFFMWLADDDWLDPDYVSECLRALRADHRTLIAAGSGRYYSGSEHVIDERPVELLERRPGARVVRYFSRVSVNGPLFGLMRRAELARVGFPQTIGGDWLLVARLAARGRVRVVRGVHVHRSITGLGSEQEQLARSFGLTGLWARHHHVWVARHLVRTLPVPLPARLMSAVLVLVRFEGAALARRMGLGFLEPLVASWLRAREP